MCVFIELACVIPTSIRPYVWGGVYGAPWQPQAGPVVRRLGGWPVVFRRRGNCLLVVHVALTLRFSSFVPLTADSRSGTHSRAPTRTAGRTHTHTHTHAHGYKSHGSSKPAQESTQNMAREKSVTRPLRSCNPLNASQISNSNSKCFIGMKYIHAVLTAKA